VTAPSETSRRAMGRLRLAVLLTGLAVVLGFALLVKETAYLFSAFMILGPLLLLAAVVLLVSVIFTELRAKQVL
jgi:hypothetical protein